MIFSLLLGRRKGGRDAHFCLILSAVVSCFLDQGVRCFRHKRRANEEIQELEDEENSNLSEELAKGKEMEQYISNLNRKATILTLNPILTSTKVLILIQDKKVPVIVELLRAFPQLALVARFIYFPEDKWIPASTNIRFGNGKHQSQYICTVPIEFKDGHTDEVTFVHYEIDGYDGVISSNTMTQWEPILITRDHLTLNGHTVPRMKAEFAFTTKLDKVNIRKKNTVWIAKQSTLIQPVIDQIKAEFASSIMTKDLNKHSRKLDCRLPLKKDNDGNQILPKAKANYMMMSPKETELCYKEINDLLSLKLISPSSSSFSCHAMYVPKYDEHGQELPEKRLVVNYKPLNACLQDNQHPLPSKDYIWQTIQGSNIYSKFDLTKGLWQISINPEDRYKTAFSIPQGLYEWNVLPFGIKTTPSIFQQHMDIIFRKYSKFILISIFFIF
ncbi:hypothetical protein SUGI_0765130 [Cryptomeria japonica]|nr:hypothetical protein SUGI_0765130 [Cryptomeria japonica]